MFMKKIHNFQKILTNSEQISVSINITIYFLTKLYIMEFVNKKFELVFTMKLHKKKVLQT